MESPTHTHTLHSNTPGHLHQAKPYPPTPAQPPPTRSSPRSRQPQYSPSNGHGALTGGILEHQCHLGSRCCFWTRGSGTGGRDKHCVGAPKPHPPLNSTPPLLRVIALSMQRQLHPILLPTTSQYCPSSNSVHRTVPCTFPPFTLKPCHCFLLILKQDHLWLLVWLETQGWCLSSWMT